MTPANCKLSSALAFGLFLRHFWLRAAMLLLTHRSIALESLDSFLQRQSCKNGVCTWPRRG